MLVEDRRTPRPIRCDDDGLALSQRTQPSRVHPASVETRHRDRVESFEWSNSCIKYSLSKTSKA
jgi:hypothetical protein